MKTEIDHLVLSAQRPHLRPLDACIVALEATSCAWCKGLLRLLKAHLEAEIPPADWRAN
jgi:hypothetical protein